VPDTLALGVVTYAPSRVLDGVKSLSYAANMLSSRLARERGFDEALLVTPHGNVLEAPTASLFWVKDGQLLTPPLESHILASITRARVMDVTDADERPCTADDLAVADEAFLASTLREVIPVHRIEDHEMAAPGPVTAQARDALRSRIEQELAAQQA
jgi:branched-chain amino acid aminotransferase